MKKHSSNYEVLKLQHGGASSLKCPVNGVQILRQFDFVLDVAHSDKLSLPRGQELREHIYKLSAKTFQRY